MEPTNGHILAGGIEKLHGSPLITLAGFKEATRKLLRS